MLSVRKQKGMAALMITMTILGVITMITLFTARVIVTDNKIYNNVQNNYYALNAAQAGFDYALGYLNDNMVAVTITNMSSCNSASNTYSLPNGTLSNGATYTMQYACRVINNTNTLIIVATGTSPDGASTRTVTAIVNHFGSSVANPITSLGNTTMTGSSTATNNYPGGTNTINAGGSVALSGSASTTTATGSPYICAASRSMPPAPPSSTCQDINFSNTALSGLSTTQFEQAFTGNTITGFSSLADISLSCTSNKIFSPITQMSVCAGPSGTLSGQIGKVIYIDMNNKALTLQATSSDFTLGSFPTTPVILVVTNASSIIVRSTGAGTVIINGNVYSDSPATIQSGVFNGLFFTSNTITVTSSSASFNAPVVGGTVDFNLGGALYDTNAATYISQSLHGYVGVGVSGASGDGGYGIVSGSWRDF